MFLTLFLFVWTLVFAQENNVWMGSLDFSLFSDGGSFTMQGYVDEDTWIALPGETGTWPYSVQAQEEYLLIVDRGGIPHTFVQKGHHTINGVFSWVRVPQSIKTPRDIGLVTATKDERSLSVHRNKNRIWYTPETMSSQNDDLDIVRTKNDQSIRYAIHNNGIARIHSIPVEYTTNQLRSIETTSSYWYKESMLHLYLSSGKHDVVLTKTLRENTEKTTTLQSKIHLQRTIKSRDGQYTIIDNWSGYREHDLLLYPEQPQILYAGSAPAEYVHIQPKHTPQNLPTNIETLDTTHTVLLFPGHERAFISWPFITFSLWFLTLLLLWKHDSIRQRRLLLFSMFLCIAISPIAILFCIVWIASQSIRAHLSSEEHIKIFSLCAFSIFAGIVMVSISPDTTHIIAHNNIIFDVYWIESQVLFSMSIVATMLFGFVLYKNIAPSSLLIFLFLLPRPSLADSGFPLCSIQLENDSIILSGQVHQSQEGEWIAPGPIGNLRVHTIIVDGEEFHAFRTTEHRFLSLFLPKGISEFEIHGSYTAPFGLHFPQQAARLDFSSSTHQIEGLEEDHSHQKTLFFWKETAPDIIGRKPRLHMDIHITPSKTTIRYTITNHKGTQTYHQPSWHNHNQELKTKATHQVFPSKAQHTWEEVVPTPDNLSFAIPESHQYEYLAVLSCTQGSLCMQGNSLWKNQAQWLAQVPISIQTVPPKEQLTWIVVPQKTPNGIWTIPDNNPNIQQVINHDPNTVFILFNTPNITYMSLCILLCFGCSFLLAKYTTSPLNLMEWLWISIGSYFLHPLALPFCILCVLCTKQRWMKYLSILGLAFIAYTATLGITSWSPAHTVLAINTTLMYEGIGVWLIGTFFFIHTLQLPQQSMEIGGSQSR